MRVLFADPDRDLLSAYQKLMETEGYTADTVFDGTQVLKMLDTAAYDLAVLNERLPRVAHGQLVRRLRDKEVPVIVLLYETVDARRLYQRDLASAYLSFPFSPADFFALAKNVLKKRQEGETLNCLGIPVDVRFFRFSGTDVCLTADEIDLLTRLFSGAVQLPAKRRVYVHALNLKLEQAGISSSRIAYQDGAGYTLMNTSEANTSEVNVCE